MNQCLYLTNDGPNHNEHFEAIRIASGCDPPRPPFHMNGAHDDTARDRPKYTIYSNGPRKKLQFDGHAVDGTDRLGRNSDHHLF